MKNIQKEAKKLSEEMIKGMQFSKKSKKPIVLVFGGFQGSGKTTIINLLKDDLNLVVISLDEIRHRMFEKGYQLDDKFRQIVKTTSIEVFKRVYQIGYSIVIDNNIIPFRLEEIKKFLNNDENNKHRLISVCLEASKEELVRRLNTRDFVPGRYQGTTNELEGSMKKYGEIDANKYDLVINTEELNAEEIAEKVKNFV